MFDIVSTTYLDHDHLWTEGTHSTNLFSYVARFMLVACYSREHVEGEHVKVGCFTSANLNLILLMSN